MSEIAIKTGITQLDLKITDGRKTLWQWDTNRHLTVIGYSKINELHYFRQGMESPLILKTYESGGKLFCNIPDELLQESLEFTVYACLIDENGNSTIFSKRFAPKERPKPIDYIYTPTEVYTVNAAIKAAIEEAIASGDFKGEPGKDGINGADGEDGYTPQKGVDYWTDADKAEIQSYIDKQMGEVSTVLDSIKVLQENYIGGETE